MSDITTEQKLAETLSEEFQRCVTSEGGTRWLPSFLKSVNNVRETLIRQKQEFEQNIVEMVVELPLQDEKLASIREHLLNRFRQLCEEKQKLSADLEGILSELQFLDQPPLTELYSRLTTLSNCDAYMSLLKHVASLESSFEDAMLSGDLLLANSFVLQHSDICNSVCFKTSCSYLSEYLVKSSGAMWEGIQSALSKQLSNLLTEISWPLNAKSVSGLSPLNAKQLSTLKTNISCLSQLTFAERYHHNSAESAPAAATEKNEKEFLFLDTIIEPFRKRFLYHFTGNRQTNALDKPEWFFGQVLSWLQVHIPFFKCEIQPVVIATLNISLGEEAALNAADLALTQFMRRLVSLAANKLGDDMSLVKDDPSLFSHLIDETILFEMELRQQLAYPEHEASCMDVLVSDANLPQWLLLEHSFNSEKVESLLTDEQAWRLGRYEELEDLDEYKVPRCIDDFVVLLQLITKRYKMIPSHTVQLRFLNTVQLQLLDDFRMRSLQLARSIDYAWDPKILQILNGISYVSTVLDDWNKLPFFQKFGAIQMSFVASQELTSADVVSSTGDLVGRDPRPKSRNAVFGECIELLKHVEHELCSQIVSALSLEAENVLLPYSTERWFVAKEPATSVTTSFCGFLSIVRDRLSFLNQSLSSLLFDLMFDAFVTELSGLLLERIILCCRFSEEGAMQLQFDVCTGFIPLLNSYSLSFAINEAMNRLSDAVNLLCQSKKQLLRLKESLDHGFTNARQLLVNLKIMSLNLDQVSKILAARVDVVRQR